MTGEVQSSAPVKKLTTGIGDETWQPTSSEGREAAAAAGRVKLREGNVRLPAAILNRSA